MHVQPCLLQSWETKTSKIGRLQIERSQIQTVPAPVAPMICRLCKLSLHMRALHLLPPRSFHDLSKLVQQGLTPGTATQPPEGPLITSLPYVAFVHKFHNKSRANPYLCLHQKQLRVHVRCIHCMLSGLRYKISQFVQGVLSLGGSCIFFSQACSKRHLRNDLLNFFSPWDLIKFRVVSAMSESKS